MMLGLKYILAQFLSGNLQESRLGSRKKTLSDATADVEIVIVRNIFLVV